MRPILAARRSKTGFRACVVFLAATLPAIAASCDSLKSLALKNATITMAQQVDAGGFTQPGGRGGGGAAFRNLLAFCRVAATLTPSADSDIKIEVWMPVSGWNGNLQSVGNGAWAGTISYPAMATALASGYATASTDTGHTGNTVTFVVGHPEKLTDFAYRAVHEMTVAAKAIIAANYGRAPARSYWNGCSTGGRQALTEAQRFPGDYDGIIAGAPDGYATRVQGAQVWIAQQTHKDEASYIPPAKYPAIHNAALQACDAMDGVKDGVIDDPTRCRFDAKVLECKDADGPSCLTAPQVEVTRKIYAGVTNSKTGKQLAPGLEPGSESGWSSLSGPEPLSLALETFQYLVFNDPKWDYHSMDAEKDIATAEKVIGPLMNVVDPNLKPFFGHGGKLLMYHGWADPGIPPLNSVNYYNSVVEKLGPKQTGNSIRLFMVPGMGHCRGGDGPDTFDAAAALAQWVEKAQAPDQIVASHSKNGAVDRTRPLCPYPQVAMYKGSGSTDEAANFACKDSGRK